MSIVNVHISIQGWDDKLSVHSLALQQAYDRHHSFELEALLPHGYDLSREKLKVILGEQVQIRIESKGMPDKQCYFTGFIDEVLPVWASHGTSLRVKGFSPTLLMDCTPRFRCFSERTLTQISNKLLDGYAGKHRPKLTCNNTGDKVPFSMQMQETDYRYLCRLADEYGKLFFYDGEQLCFGTLDAESGQSITLDYKQEINHLALSLNLAPLGFKLNGYDLERGEYSRYNAGNEIKNSNALVQAVMEKSKCYPAHDIHLNHLTEGQDALQATARQIAAQQAHELVVLQGACNHPGLKVGSKISFKDANDPIGKGSYIILAVHHEVGGDNSYQNTFTAVPSGFPFPMRMQQGRSPICGPLMAIVKDNNDPKKLGRVKVEFIGDSEKTLSPWLRVLTPYTKYGGMFFLPEKGDQVVVFHEDFNAEKSPFVLGCFYHAKATADKWKDADNKKKGIALDKISLLFDDRSGKLTIEAEEIEIKAKRGMSLDGGQRLMQKAGRIDLN